MLKTVGNVDNVDDVTVASLLVSSLLLVGVDGVSCPHRTGGVGALSCPFRSHFLSKSEFGQLDLWSFCFRESKN